MKRDYSAAVAAYTAGKSLGDIASEMGVSRQAVWYALKQRGIEMRPHVEFGEKNHFYRGGERSIKSAQQKVKRALKTGRLVRQPCEVCGDAETRGHHDDYSKPLEVRWLCAGCHFEWHKHNRARLPEDERKAA